MSEYREHVRLYHALGTQVTFLPSKLYTCGEREEEVFCTLLQARYSESTLHIYRICGSSEHHLWTLLTIYLIIVTNNRSRSLNRIHAEKKRGICTSIIKSHKYLPSPENTAPKPQSRKCLAVSIPQRPIRRLTIPSPLHSPPMSQPHILLFILLLFIVSAIPPTRIIILRPVILQIRIQRHRRKARHREARRTTSRPTILRRCVRNRQCRSVNRCIPRIIHWHLFRATGTGNRFPRYTAPPPHLSIPTTKTPFPMRIPPQHGRLHVELPRLPHLSHRMQTRPANPPSPCSIRRVTVTQGRRHHRGMRIFPPNHCGSFRVGIIYV